MDQLGDRSNISTNKPTVCYNPRKCPVCSCHFDSEETCFEHFLNHFENSKNSLFQRCNLVFWLNSYAHFTPEKVTTNESLTSNGEGMNKFIESTTANAYQSVESAELPTYSCTVCNKSFLDEDQMCIHSFIHFELKVPSVSRQLKCPLCEKYFSRRESCLMHIFTHMKMPTSERTPMELLSTTQERFQFITNWISAVFGSESWNIILIKYKKYEQLLKSPLLSKILWSEIEALKKCKFCQNPVTSVFDLLDNHRECKPGSLKSVVCVMCNFKAETVDTLILHFFKNHVVCYCGFSGEDFSMFMEHSKECFAHKSGVVCPCCQTANFVTETAFKEHIAGTTRWKTCGSQLKKNKWACTLCKKQCSQTTIFNHILSEHVNCLCGFRGKNLKSFFIHTAKCATKKNSISCPICHKMKCSTETLLQQHVARCLPWNQSSNLLKQPKVGEATKRKLEELFVVQKPSKRTKFNLEVDYVNCASQ